MATRNTRNPHASPQEPFPSHDPNSPSDLPLGGEPFRPKLALVYLRVSTARQAKRDGEIEGYSIPAQRTSCHKRAHELDAAVEEFVDAGASARSADRPGLQALLARLADPSQPPVDYVIVHKLDRLARDRADDVAILLAIRQAGATLVSVSEMVDETPAGTLMHGIVASFAEYYSRNLSTEAKKGMSEKVKRGGTPGQAPIGYLNVVHRVDGTDIKSVVIDEVRGHHMAWAFEQYATGEWSIAALRDELEARGLRSRPTKKYVGTPLSRAQLHRLLSNPYYKGLIRFKGVLFEGKHPPLVDEITWQQVQDVLAGRRIAGDRSWKHGHYLKGSLRCQRCGGRIGYGWSRGKGGRYDYFFCLGRHTGRSTCDLPYIPASAIEDKVAERWGRIRFSETEIASIREEVLADAKQLRDQHTQLAEQQRRRLIQLERQKTKLIDAYMADAIPVEDLKQRQTAVMAEIADARRLIQTADIQLADLNTQLDVVLGLLTHARTLYERADGTARQLLNSAMFAWLTIDSHDDPDASTSATSSSGWTPQEAELAGGELSEIVGAVLGYHPDVREAATEAKDAGGFDAQREAADANSGSAMLPTRVHTPHIGGLGVFRRALSTQPHARTDDAAAMGIAGAVSRSDGRGTAGQGHDAALTPETVTTRRNSHKSGNKAGQAETPAKLAFDRGSNVYYLAEDRGFEPLRALTQPAFQASAIGH